MDDRPAGKTPLRGRPLDDDGAIAFDPASGPDRTVWRCGCGVVSHTEADAVAHYRKHVPTDIVLARRPTIASA